MVGEEPGRRRPVLLIVGLVAGVILLGSVVAWAYGQNEEADCRSNGGWFCGLESTGWTVVALVGGLVSVPTLIVVSALAPGRGKTDGGATEARNEGVGDGGGPVPWEPGLDPGGADAGNTRS